MKVPQFKIRGYSMLYYMYSVECWFDISSKTTQKYSKSKKHNWGNFLMKGHKQVKYFSNNV